MAFALGLKAEGANPANLAVGLFQLQYTFTVSVAPCEAVAHIVS